MLLNVKEDFEDNYADSWCINGVHLENVPNIHKLYKQMMLECDTIPAMMAVVRQFRFFTWGQTLSNLNHMSNFWVPSLKDYFLNKVEPKEYEMDLVAPIIVPWVMIQSYTIAEKFGIPEFYAGVQYIRATMFRDDSLVKVAA
jgi:hypothetical protein